MAFEVNTRIKSKLLFIPIVAACLLSLAILPANAAETSSTYFSQPTIQDLEAATESQREAYFRSMQLLEKTRQITEQSGDRSAPQIVLFTYGNSGGATVVEVTKCALFVGPLDCYTAKNDADTASLESSNLYPAETLHNGRGDAFRHCYWNALMTIHINYNQAKIIADQHENSSSGPDNEKSVDRKNNEVGRRIGISSGNENSAKLECQAAVSDGRLQTSI